MSQELRRRTTGGAGDMQTNNDDDQFLSSRNGAGLSAAAMMKASPSQFGETVKLHVPIFFSILPTFIQRLVVSTGVLRCLAPTWTERFLIQIGCFLYKFSDETSKTPKGTPFAIDSVDVHLVEFVKGNDLDGADFVIPHLPSAYKSVFVVSTLRKKHYYAVRNNCDAIAWVNSIREGRQEAISRSMGHTNQMPYPQSWSYFDTMAKTFVKSKERIKARMEESNIREMEMSTIGEGGPAPRGFYG